MVKMHVLVTSLVPLGGQDGKLCNGTNSTIGKLSHSNDVIGACICSNDVNVCGSAHFGCMVNGTVAMAAF